MYRNFIRPPKVLSFLLFTTLYVNWVIMAWPTNPWIVLIISILIGACWYHLGIKLSEYLILKRVQKWAYNNYSVEPEDLEEWLAAIDPVDLDNMVAMDIEGWDAEEPYSGCSCTPEEEVK